MTELSRLEQCSSYFHSDTFEVWDAIAQDFVAGFVGRLYPRDRFKSIYHRPMQRETLGVAEGTTLPDTDVIKHTATDTVFIASRTRRRDSDEDVTYDSLISLHAVYPESGGLGVLKRPMVSGAGDNLGPVSRVDQGNHHYSLELRTQTADSDAHEISISQLFITMPIAMGAIEGDYLVALDGTEYRLDVVYVDAGYLMARAVKEPYEKVDFTYHLPVGTGGGYDPVTGAVTGIDTVDRVVSGVIVISMTDINPDKLPTGVPVNTDIEVAVDFDHIGFTPYVDHEFTYSGIKYKIHKVTIGDDRRQWIILARRID